jgi:uncharacterized protein (DUF2147 family)
MAQAPVSVGALWHGRVRDASHSPRRNVTLDRAARVGKSAPKGRMNMKILTLAAIGSLLATAVWAADPVEGVWQTEVDDGAYAHVTMAACGAAFCGKITESFNADGSPYPSENIGKTIVIDMIPQGGAAYEGSVFRPSNGKTYFGTISLEGNKLRLAGCVMGGLICSKQTWSRVK